MKKIIILGSLIFSFSTYALDFGLALYFPVAGSSEYYNANNTINESGNIGAGDFSYLLKIDHALTEQFSLGLEAGRYAFNAHFERDSDYFSKPFTTDQPYGLRLSYTLNEHMFTLIFAKLYLSDGSNYYASNSIDGLFEYSYNFSEHFNFNARYLAVEGDDRSSNSYTSSNNIILLGLTYKI